jgi:ArsR family transcriptional regulator
MGITKSEIFTTEQNQLAALAKTFGHPARLMILQHLFSIKDCVCGDLVEEIGLAQATISQHLTVLKNVGLIKGSVAGTRVCYCIDTEKWCEMKHIMNAFLNQDVNSNDCC